MGPCGEDWYHNVIEGGLSDSAGAASIVVATSDQRTTLNRTWTSRRRSPTTIFPDLDLIKFCQISEAWLGHGDSDFDPAIIMHHLQKTVKGTLDRHYQNVANKSRGTSRNEGFANSTGDSRYQSCAVVGNSGILLNRYHGEQIDRNEVVIRLNDGKIYPDHMRNHVGSKTTLSFLNSTAFLLCAVKARCSCHPYGDDIPVMMYISEAHHLMPVAMCRSQRKSPLLLTTSAFDALCAAIVKRYSLRNFAQTTGKKLAKWASVGHGNDHDFHYSSGVQAIVLALAICNNVQVYGFQEFINVRADYHTDQKNVSFWKFTNARQHYQTQQKEERNIQDYAAGHLFYDNLVNYRKVPLLSDNHIEIPFVQIFL